MSTTQKPGAETNQTYQGRVENVINAETINFGRDTRRLADAEDDLPDKAILAPTLIDRSLQWEPLYDRLEAMQESDPAYPLLVVVPGCKDDLHEAFVVRCAEIELVEAFGGVGAWRDLKVLAWPEGGSIEAILRGVRSAANMPKNHKRADVEAAIANLGRHLCFSHFVDGQRWEADDGALVKAWVDYFVRGTIRVQAGYLVVAFLCVELAEPRTKACRDIEAFVDALRAQQGAEGGRVFVTRPLELIRKVHVTEWTGRVSRYLEGEVKAADLVGLPASAFTDETPLRRLGEVYDSMFKALARAVRRARFGEHGPP